MALETRFLIVDGNSIACRGAYAKPDLHTKTGVPTGGTYLFFIMLNGILHKIKPTHVLIAFDVSRHTFRADLNKDYKGNRGSGNDSLKKQFQQIQRIIFDTNIRAVGVEGFEADDVIGTYVNLSNADKNYILTGDKDSFQLISDNTHVLYPKVGISQMEIITPRQFNEMFEIKINQYVDFKTLKGDASDNVEGCPGCGEKTASRLLVQYGDLKGISEHAHEIGGKFGQKLRDWLPKSEAVRELMKIRWDVPVPFTFDECEFKPNWNNAKPHFKELELNNLINKLDGGDFYG